MISGTAGTAVLAALANQARRWLAVQDDRPDWREAAFSTDTWLKLTPDELVELHLLIAR